MPILHYKNLIVWQKSIDLVDEIYKVTRQLPKAELYGLASQMQRAAVSIPSNIAEGQSRNHLAEYIQFLGISYASTAELETQLIITKKQYADIDCMKAENLLVEVQKMLNVLIRNLKTKNKSSF
jgi:four helix bundle protein